MKILIVGAGATGGYFGGRLALAGRDVTFLVRGSRAESLRQNGLQIISPFGDASLKPQLIEAGQIEQPFDLILLTVKAYALDSAINDIAPAVGSNTVILPMLNGMKHIETLSARFGRRAILGGLCKIAGTLDEQGRVVQLNRLHDLTYGELDGSSSTRIAQIDRVLQDAGFNARLSKTIGQDMWDKWIFLASLGAITCLMRGNVGQIVAAPGGVNFIRTLIAEIASVASATGHTPNSNFMAETTAALTQPDSLQTSSMYRDLSQGYMIEVEQIIGDLVAIAHKHGLVTPLLAIVYTNLSVYQNQHNAKR